MINALTKSNLGQEGLFHGTGYSPSPRDDKAGSRGRSLKQKSQRNTAFWFMSRLMLSYLSYTAQSHTWRNGTNNRELDPLHHLGIKKMPLRCAHKPNWLRQVFNWSSFFLSLSSCQPRIIIKRGKLNNSTLYIIRQYLEEFIKKKVLKTGEKEGSIKGTICEVKVGAHMIIFLLLNLDSSSVPKFALLG